MRTHLYKFIFIVISLCALATTNAWAKYIYIDVTKLQNAPAPSTRPSYTGDYYIEHLRVHTGIGSNVKTINLDKNDLLTINRRKLYKVEVDDNTDRWQISAIDKDSTHKNQFYHPRSPIQYNTSRTYQNKYIIKQVQWLEGDTATGEVVHMIGIVTGGLIYFDNSKTNWSSPIQMVIGHGSYARTYDLKQITGTDLWYVNLDNKDAEWPDATYFAFINTRKAHILRGTTPEQAVQGKDGHGTPYPNTEIYRTPTELFKGSKYIFKPQSSDDNTPMTCTPAAPTEFNITQKVKIRDYEGANYQEITSNFPATFTLKTHTLNTDTTAVAETKSGKSTLTSQSVYAGSTTFSYTNLTETETNFKFDGWGTGKLTATGNSYPNNYSQETTMYAFFTRKYAFSFSAQTGGTMTAKVGTTTLTSGNHVAGGPITLTATPSTGYHFVKWVDGSGKQLSTSATYTHTLSADITIEAVFSNTYTVTLNNQDATTAGAISVTATYGAAMPSIANNLPKKTGYTFNGYFDATSGGTNYYNANGTSACNWNKTSNTTLYAKWTAKTNTAYTVNHYQQNVDDSYPTTPTETQNLTGTTATSVSPAVKSYTGFTAPSTQTVTIAADGSTVVNYQYTRNSYTLTWNLDGGTISSAGTAAGAVKYGATLTPPTVTRVGYNFGGWSPSVPATMPANHSTYTAQWNFAMEYEVTGSALITSANGKTVKATDTLTLQVSNMPVGTTVNISAPKITFYDQAGKAVTSLTTTSTPQTFNLTVAYTPTADNTTEQPTITLDVLNHKKTFANLISCRSLPATFAIVTKVGNTWYALPSQGLNSKDALVGYPVEVDSPNDPTVVTNLPANADWSLRQVYVGQERDRFKQNGANIVLVNNEATAQALNASSSDNYLLTNVEYESYHNTTNPALYEWTPATTNLTTYQLTNAGRTDVKLSMNIKNIFGVHKQNVVTSDLRFLPINDPSRTTSFDMQVVEWYPTKVLVQTETALTSVSAIVGGKAVASPVVTNKGAKLYEISGLPLENNPTKVLTISYDTYSCSKVIPIIISRGEKTVVDPPFSTLTNDIYNYSDLVVRDNATLTINGTDAQNKFTNVTIYPTAKISVPEGEKLSVYTLTFFGGIDDIYNGSTYELNKYGVPQLSLKGTLGKTVTTIDYLMRVDLDQMYSLALPYNVALSDITYGDGTKITLGDALYVSAYDGQARANREKNTWIYETDFVSKLGAATLKAGVGYTISAEPQVAGDEYSILRMPMKSNISSGSTEGAKTINVVAYDNQRSVAITDNHKGWNLVGNPYMTTITGADDDNLVLGYLQETGTGPWEWVEKTYRYVTIPSDNGEWYEQKKFAEATLPPFKNFFVQIGTTGDLQFGLGTRQSMPARYLQQEQAPREVEFELLLSNDLQSDNTGLLISEDYTPAYEINADLEKMIGNMSIYTIYNGYNLAFNALNPTNAEEQIPMGYVVPATGEYTFALDEHGDLDDIEHIYLLDYDKNITTDLMEDIYTFAATEKKSDKRFAISVVLKAEEEVETPTQLETLEWESDRPCKFIYQDKMYILRNGVIYDAMGKQVQTINK